jgi:hypothetical protein
MDLQQVNLPVKRLTQKYKVFETKDGADAVAFGFLEPNSKPKMLYYKMNPLEDGDVRI